MAQFRGTVEGNRGEASRLGTPASGMVTTCNGWNMGVTVIATHNDGVDRFEVLKTGGSNNNWKRELVIIVEEGE